MTADQLKQYLHEHIPMSKAMCVEVDTVASDRVTLSAPIAPNINHRETVFGGSASALAILSGWALVHCRLAAEGHRSRLVIQRNSMSYDRPIVTDFRARATIESDFRWQRFVRLLTRRGKARLTVASVLSCGNETVGVFEGEFVALAQS